MTQESFNYNSFLKVIRNVILITQNSNSRVFDSDYWILIVPKACKWNTLYNLYSMYIMCVRCVHHVCRGIQPVCLFAHKPMLLHVNTDNLLVLFSIIILLSSWRHARWLSSAIEKYYQTSRCTFRRTYIASV